jgi:putative ABC transport system permease protein
MQTLTHDLRFALRQLRLSAGFTLTAVLMLALGIGATTAIFSIVEGVLLRPLPFPQPGRVMVISDLLTGVDAGGDGGVGVTVPDIKAYTRDTHSFESLGGYQMPTGFELSGVGDPAPIAASRLSSGVFPALAVQPLMGRVFTQQDDEQSQPVVVLSYETWQSRMHGDPKVLGSKILLDRKPYEVIGVMPRDFEFPLVPGHLYRSEMWVPISFSGQELAESAAANWSYQMVGRLKPGITPELARQDADRVAQEIMRGYPAFMANFRIRPIVRSLQENTVEQARPLVRTLFLAVSVVLLIACANLAGLLLVRAIRRRREFAVRLALGASAGTLLRQVLLESLVLSVSGGVLGLLLASVALRVGVKMLPETLPRISEIGLDWKVVAFSLLLAGLTGVLCGLIPAFASIRTNVNDVLKEGGRTGSAGGGHARLRSALVIAEIAVALVLLTASGLLLRSFEKMREVDPGYRPDHALTASYNLPGKNYGTQALVNAFDHELRRRLEQLPGVSSVALTSFVPGSGADGNQAFVAEGYVTPKGSSMNLATPIQVEGNYFEAIGTPLRRGRFFTEADKAGAQLVVIVNQKLAEKYWPGQDPIGKRLRVGTVDMKTPWLTIVGEVADMKQSSPDDATKNQFYQPIEQVEEQIGMLASPSDLNGNSGFIVLRTQLAPEQMENALRATVRSLDPQLPLGQVQTMEQAVSTTEAPRRFNTALITTFAAAAVLLAILGIYSVIAFSVALRVQEMAIRIALGSQRTGILRLVLVSGAKLAAIGCVIGLLGAVGASKLLGTFLFGVSPFDPLVLSLSAVAILLLALAASVLPARRAAHTDPMTVLRAQ